MLDKQDIEVLKELIQTELRPIHGDIRELKVDTEVLKVTTQGLKADTEALKTTTQGLKTDTEALKITTKELKTGQDKHSLLLEELKASVNTIIEGQQAHAEQNNHQFTDLKQDMKDDSTLIKSALKTVSGDVKNVKKTVDTLEEKYQEVQGATAQNSYDVQVLRNGYKKSSQG